MDLEKLLYQALKSVESYARNLVRAHEVGDADFRREYSQAFDSCKLVIEALDAYESSEARHPVEEQHVLILIANTSLVEVLELAALLARRYVRDHPHDYDCLTGVPLIETLLTHAKALAQGETNH